MLLPFCKDIGHKLKKNNISFLNLLHTQFTHSSHCHIFFGSCIKNVFGFHSRELFALSKADFFFKRDRHVIVDEFTTTYVIRAYHHYRCEFELRSLSRS